MSTAASYASEALIGPPSEPISVREFIQACSRSSGSHPRRVNTTPPSTCDRPEPGEIEEVWSVADLQASLNETLSNPYKYAFLVRNHENTIDHICSASKSNITATAAGQPSLKPARSRKRKRAERSTREDEEGSDVQLHPDIVQLKNHLENIALSCWSYPTDAAFFIRPQKNSDLNILTKPKCSRRPEQQQRQDHGRQVPSPSSPSSATQQGSAEAVLTVSIYNRLSWGNHLSRSSQHAVLASQTIGDLYDVIPCPSNEIPDELHREEQEETGDRNGEIVGYNSDELPPHRGAVVCIEGVAYGDGQEEEDYSDKLVQQMDLLPEKKRKPISKGMCMYEQRFVDLTVRLNEPYWLLHQGTCEHFLVIDGIRMLHPSDPPESNYPFTLHIAPPILDLCMACSRVPATLSVVGDVRLGQSPFKICRPCWELFGEPSPPRLGDSASRGGVVVVPLPKYEYGW